MKIKGKVLVISCKLSQCLQYARQWYSKAEMPKNVHACPSINKSTERHPHVPYYSLSHPPPPPNLAVWNHCKTPFYSLHYNLSPQVRLLDMDAQKAAQYCEIFPLWRCCQPWNATFSVNPVYVYGFSRSHLWVQCNWWIDFDRLVIRNRELKKTTTVTRMPPKSVERRLCTCVINRTFLSRPPHSN